MRGCILCLLFLLASVAGANAEPPCGLSSVVETKEPVYPPIARAAHVTGQVILIADFAQNGSISQLRILSGPEMLKAPTIEFVKGWKANPYGGTRTCPVVVSYALDAGESQETAGRKDAQHFTILGHNLLLIDEAADIGKRHHRFWLF